MKWHNFRCENYTGSVNENRKYLYVRVIQDLIELLSKGK